MTQYLENTNNPVNENRITVMSKAGFAPEPKRSYAGDIWGIIVSILLIIGGAKRTIRSARHQQQRGAYSCGFPFPCLGHYFDNL